VRGGAAPKRRGNSFEGRVLKLIIKNGFTNCKHQPFSGASSYKEDKSDLIGTKVYNFLFECKKTMKSHITFSFDWIETNRKIANEINKIPVVAFAGGRTDVYIATEINLDIYDYDYISYLKNMKDSKSIKLDFEILKSHDNAIWNIGNKNLTVIAMNFNLWNSLLMNAPKDLETNNVLDEFL